MAGPPTFGARDRGPSSGNRPDEVEGPRLAAGRLETRRLSRKVGSRFLVQDIGVEVAAGEILGITGPSGAGKSSFLRLLNRLDEPTSGSVFVGGEDYRSIPPQHLRRRVGMVMQTGYLFPGTVGVNIAFGLRQRGETLTPAAIVSLLE
jgi:putative ABC transport system ATP-binding protein